MPVFACAAAVAALRHLHQDLKENQVTVALIKPPTDAIIDIEQVAQLDQQSALAITRSDPGEHLDITRNTPIWALVQSRTRTENNQQLSDVQVPIEIRGGEGIGRQLQRANQAAIYNYARQLILTNLEPWLKPNEQIIVTIILPEGKKLAQRTSNEAFGIVEGLSLLGTTGIVQPLTAPAQLETFQAELKEKVSRFDSLVFCVGENGLDLARQSGINSERLIKTANWLGSMLVVAGLQGIESILLFGYHGKLIKLAGGIFHTHHHLADARLEILTAHCGSLGLSTPWLQRLLASPTTEAALQLLRELDQQEQSDWVEKVTVAIAESIDRRTQAYIRKHTEREVTVGSVLFDRQRRIITKSKNALGLMTKLC